MPLTDFHPVVRQWFTDRFTGGPTEPQIQSWPHIAAGGHVLIAAPTGSGKTLSAFLVGIDRLLRRAIGEERPEGALFDSTHALPDTVDMLYVSPLKALSNDVQRNLTVPLMEIHEAAVAAGYDPTPIRVAVRTGDTPASERAAMLKRPPQILVTTPESLYLLLTSPKSREILRNVRTVIVDEIHALARDKRGSHLTLSLARLDALCATPPTRIGLSATQRPLDEIARFLIGSGNVNPDNTPRCTIVDVGHLRQLDLGIEVPPSELEAVCSHEQWGEVYERIVSLIQSHRSTLIFVNTRRLAERVTHKLAELLGEEAVASHHGSLSRQLRHSAEQRLKDGQLKAVVATASLELGIDVGYIDLVCQIGSPRSIATFLQRIGRAGHNLGSIPKGRLFPLTRDELIECLALLRAAKHGRLDMIEIPQKPLDILAQQIVAAASCDEWNEDALFALCRNAWPYHDLERSEFDEIVKLLHEGMSTSQRQAAFLFRDAVNGTLKARRHARLAALMNGGAIPELADYRVVTEEDRTFVGSVNEDFAIESLAGDVFLLGNQSWRIRYVRGGEVVVSDAKGAPASVPFWLGEAPGRTDELSTEVSRLREEIADRVDVANGEWGMGNGECPSPAAVFDDDYAVRARDASAHSPLPIPHSPLKNNTALDWLSVELPTQPWALEQAVRYVAAQKAAIGFVPTRWKILFERFFDESGGMQVVIHAPLGARVTRAWGLAIRKRFCRSFDFELQASADDDGFVLAVGPQHSFPLDALFKMLNRSNGEPLLTQALLAAPMFETRWRWNSTRSLAVARMKSGKKVPPFLQRFKADDLLASVFPAKTGCFENHHGDIDVPDHPLVRQTIKDCHTEAMDLRRWLDTLDDFASGKIEFIGMDTREPSPFAHELVNANPYAFLDDAPLEERRARAVATRRGTTVDAVRDLGRLEPAAIEQVRSDAWPLVRDADELHDVLLNLVILSAEQAEPWRPWFDLLRKAGRAALAIAADDKRFWIAAERLLQARALLGEIRCEPEIKPLATAAEVSPSEALVAALRGWMPCLGPTTVEQLAASFSIDPSRIGASLEALEGEGSVLRGTFTATGQAALAAGQKNPEWCDRRLLARIHRLTLDGLRKQIQPVEPADFVRFLLTHQRLAPELKLRGRAGLRETIDQLQGLEIPAGAWESRVVGARVADYDPTWLDELSLSGEVVWGRLRPPSRDDEAGPSSVGLSRVMPIALAARQDLAWLLPPDRRTDDVPLRGNAAEVLETLTSRGALFYHDLLGHTSMLPGHLDAALYELAAQGLVSSDAYGAVRALTADDTKRATRVRLKTRRRRSVGASTMAGRWSLFPGYAPVIAPEERVTKWAWQLLKRWGVVFRDLIERETCAPPWGAVAGQYRRMEARGEIRGGRFVAGVGGEQFALPTSVEKLRLARDQADSGQLLLLSAADPLNLTCIVLPGARLPAVAGNSLALRDGRIVAVRQAGEVKFIEKLDAARTDELIRKWQRTG